jgi:RimK family alpha-L-glutamate ligase
MHFLFIAATESRSAKSPTGYLKRFETEAIARGHTTEWLEVEHFVAMDITDVPKADMVVYSLMPSNIAGPRKRLIALEKAGWNFLRSMSQPASDKLSGHQALEEAGVPLPQTWVLTPKEKLPTDLPMPVVLKGINGCRGQGVYLAHTEAERDECLAELFESKNYVLAQEVIHPLGRDMRVFMVRDRVVAAMERVAQEGEFRANVGQGANGRKVTLTDEEVKVAKQAMNALGYTYGGVDLARSTKGPIVFEVNKGPAVAGVESVTGINVSKEVIIEAERMHAQNSTD